MLRFAYTSIIALMLASAGNAIGQETIFIGGPRPQPGIEVNLDAIGGPARGSALQYSRTPKPDARPDLLPRNSLNMPRARAVTAQPLAAPPSAAPQPTGEPEPLSPKAQAKGQPTPLQPQAAARAPAMQALPPPPPIPSARPMTAARKPETSPEAPPSAAPEAAYQAAAEVSPAPGLNGAAVSLSSIMGAGKIDAGQPLLLFESGSAALPAIAEAQLAALAQKMRDGGARVQLKSNASGSDDGAEARRISLKRALAARAVLIGQGIDSTRIDVRALGPAADGGPADRIEVIVLSQ